MSDTDTTVEKVPVTCCVTGTVWQSRPGADGEPICPKGWKRFRGEYYSPEGWRQKFFLRTIHLPVASVVAEYDPPDWSQGRCRTGWVAFRPAIRAACRQAAQFTVWCNRELAKADNEALVPNQKGTGLTVPKWTVSKELNQSLYSGGRLQWPELDSQSLGSLRQKAISLYKEHRWEMRVTCQRSLPSTRDDVPIPIPEKDARLSIHERQPFLRLRVQGQRFTLRLRNGWKLERKISALERVLAGEGVQGEVSLYEQVEHSDSGNGSTHRTEPGANRYPTIVMAAITIWLPKTPGAREKVLVVKTGPDRLWTSYLDGQERPWHLNADEALRFLTAHTARNRRLAEDRKFEKRSQVSNNAWKQTPENGRTRRRKRRAVLNGLGEELSRNRKQRMQNLLHLWSKQLVGFAFRNKADRIQYDDADQRWRPSFEWFKLRSLVEQKANELGISFEHISTSGAPEPDEVLE